MKNSARKKPDYRQLKNKLFRNVILTIIAAITVVFLILLFFRGKLGDFIVQGITVIFNVQYNDALNFYQTFFRNNIEYYLIAAFIVFFLLLFRLLLSWFTKYFNEINDGIDKLIADDGKNIALSPEMDFMERKLNVLKETLEKREREAKEAEQKKNDLIMYLAHDIKTPLTSVIGYLSLLDEATDMPIQQKAKYVNITLKKAYRLEQLINEFFEITRYNLRAMPLEKKNIDIVYMLLQMTDEAYPQLAAHEKRTVVNAPEDMMIYGDPNKLARVFNNILKNAIAYSNDGSVIEISADIRGAMSVIQFKNEGSIPKEKLNSIFEKFYRLDDARSSDTGGTGLGLAIAKEIVTLHGGTIEVESENGYTAFKIQLPNMKVGEDRHN